MNSKFIVNVKKTAILNLNLLGKMHREAGRITSGSSQNDFRVDVQIWSGFLWKLSRRTQEGDKIIPPMKFFLKFVSSFNVRTLYA